MTELIHIEEGFRLIDGELINAMIDAIEASGVSTVSVVTANGVSGTVANPTTTPAITLTLGAITPSSVAATGNVTGLNLSGTNTGDQTIILTGDVTGAGTGSFAATIANGAVSLAKMANLAANSILGNNTGSPATPLALTAAQTKTLLSLNNVENTALSTWAGSTNLTTLGTIATGTWQGTVVGSTYGGTGVNNGSNTITLAGNLVTSGANSLTLTTTGSTNVTLPTSGTLVNTAVTTLSSLASVGTITTGTWNAGAITSSGNIAYTGQSYGNVQTLTDAATIAWNMNLGGIATVTPTTNRAIGAPTNIQAGGTYALRVISGGFTLTWNAVFKWPGGVAPTSGGGTDVYTFVSFDGSTLDGVGQVSFS